MMENTHNSNSGMVATGIEPWFLGIVNPNCIGMDIRMS